MPLDPLVTVAQAAHVREGPEAVRRVLVGIFRARKLSTRKAARQAALPVPVAAAVLRELGKLGLVSRDGGACLTGDGLYYAQAELGLYARWDTLCPHCGGQRIVIDPELQPEVRELRKLGEARPAVDWTLDQSHATPATSFRRALLMHHNGDLEGRKVAFLGDDDITSLAAGLLLRRSGAGGAMTVLEYDRRLVGFLSASAEELHAQCQVEAFDLMWRLPGSISGQHDVVLCDPPYTVPGLRLFVSRAIDALRPGPGKHIYLSYPQKPPDEALVAQCWLAERGLLVREVIRGFNRYHGAGVLANQSDMIVPETTGDTRPDAEADSLTDIYTYSRRTRRSRYLCKQCGAEHTVGPRRDYVTIQDLKRTGCPSCGGTRFDRTAVRAATREGNPV